MKILDTLEKRFGFLAVPNVVLTLVIAQLIIYAAIMVGRVEYGYIILIPKAVFAGEWWRLVSFLIAPPYVPGTLFQGIFLAFFWYIFWMMSHTLESAWGVFRFNVFLLAGLLFTLAGAFLGQIISPATTIVLTPYFLYLSIFFAFATLNPNIEFLLFFVIPMKVKWLAWFTAAITALSLLAAPSMGERVAILAPVLNYLLFFKDALSQSVKSRQRRKKFDADKLERANGAIHTCAECDASDQSDPERDFRYKVVDGDAICLCNVCRATAADS